MAEPTKPRYLRPYCRLIHAGDEVVLDGKKGIVTR
jgi:hypothetical protein